MQDIIMIGGDFKTDIRSVDLEILLQPKLWGELETNPDYHAIDAEIVEWLKKHVPETYRIAVESSKRKAHDMILINAIKAKVLFEQLDLAGLRSLQRGRFFNLTNPVYDNVFSYVKKSQKKHDVRPELVKIAPLSGGRILNVEAVKMYSGATCVEYYLERVNEILVEQPDSKYLNMCKTLNLEAELLDQIRRSIDEVSFAPKDQSDYQTCACCFRWVRLQPSDRSRIAYHGYEISKYLTTRITEESCKGAEYPPFQVSANGTIEKLKYLRGKIEYYQQCLEKLDPKSQDREELGQIEEYQSNIRGIEFFMKYALQKIARKHPDRLSEAEAI